MSISKLITQYGPVKSCINKQQINNILNDAQEVISNEIRSPQKKKTIGFRYNLTYLKNRKVPNCNIPRFATFRYFQQIDAE